MAQENFLQKVVSSWAFGLCCLVLAAISNALFNLTARNLMLQTADDPLPPLYIIMMRQTVIFLVSIPCAIYNKAPLFKFNLRNWTWLFLRAAVALPGTFATKLALLRIPLPDFTTIFATSIFLTSIVSWPILKERPKITDIPLLIGCFIGAVFIVRPSFIFENEQSLDLLGCFYTLCSIVSQVAVYICYRKLHNVPTLSILFVYGMLTSSASLIALLSVTPRLPPCALSTRLLTIVIGFFSCSSVLMQTLASKSLRAGFLAITPILEVAIQFIIHIIATGSLPSLYSVIGALCIFGAFLLLALRTYLIQRISNRLATKTSYEDMNRYKFLRCLVS